VLDIMFAAIRTRKVSSSLFRGFLALQRRFPLARRFRVLAAAAATSSTCAAKAAGKQIIHQGRKDGVSGYLNWKET